MTYTTFSVGVGSGMDNTTYFPIAVFDKQSGPMADRVAFGSLPENPKSRKRK